MAKKLYTAVAIRTGFWGGARRRPGETFTVEEGDKESWFKVEGPAPAGSTADPVVPTAAQAPRKKTFTDAMSDISKGKKPKAPQTLSEADLVG